MRTVFIFALLALGILGLCEFSTAAIGEPCFGGFSGWDPCGVLENTVVGMLALISLIVGIAMVSQGKPAREPIAAAPAPAPQGRPAPGSRDGATLMV